MPIYALRPQGPFASDTYSQIRQFLREQLDEGVERVSIPAYGTGQSATLFTGQTIPVIQPELRGMASWTKKALVEHLVTIPSKSVPEAEQETFKAKMTADLSNFLERAYYELRNLGMTPQERALNYAATNAFKIMEAFAHAFANKMELDVVDVRRSPICRSDSDCWDVKLYFFYPLRENQTVRRVYRFTVDVSDVVPVVVGDMKTWSTR